MSTIHASACIIGRHGVLLRGASGAGKSLLARMLIEVARLRDEFGIWVADDQVTLNVAGGALLAKPVPVIEGRAELRFHGILPVAHAPAARIDLVVDLTETVDRLPALEFVSVETVRLPRIFVPQNDLAHARAVIEAHLLQIR